MKAYKGFDQNLKCRGFQYEVGKDYKEPKAALCKKGFHACENPMDVFSYYPPADGRYCEVELDGVAEETGEDSKRVGKKIHIALEIGLKGIVEAGVKFILDHVDWSGGKESNTGDWSAATNTGNRSAATNTGNRSAATNTGDWSAATNTGNRSAATNTGDWSAATNTGNQSAATNTGNWSAAKVGGTESVAIVTGYNGKAAGAVGCWLVLTERDGDMHILSVKSVCVDGETIKPDVYYTLRGGEVIEAE